MRLYFFIVYKNWTFNYMSKKFEVWLIIFI